MNIWREGYHYHQTYTDGVPDADIQEMEPTNREQALRFVFIQVRTSLLALSLSMIIGQAFTRAVVLNSGVRIVLTGWAHR